MGYGLGIDVGTTFTAAALFRDGNVEVFPLATYQNAVPSVIFADGEDLLFAGAAERRGASQPLGLAREFKRRLGDPVPIVLSGAPYHADRLTALMARWVADSVTEQVGEPPDRIVMTHPANWTEYQLGMLRNALADVGLGTTELISEPTAATLEYAAAANVEPNSSVLVYDLGGGTFDVALLRRHGDTFEQQIEPAGIERLGGIDFDEAVFQYVKAEIPADAYAAAREHPDGPAAIAQLRRRCVDAKEALSSDAAGDVPVMLPGYTATVRITRPEFEAMIRPMVAPDHRSGRGHPRASGRRFVVARRRPARRRVVADPARAANGVRAAARARPRRCAPQAGRRQGRGAAGRDRGGGRCQAVALGVCAAPARTGRGRCRRRRRQAHRALGGDRRPAARRSGGRVLPVLPRRRRWRTSPTTTVTEPDTSTGASGAVAPTTAGSSSPTTSQANVAAVAQGEELWAAPTGGPIGSVRGPSVDTDSVVFASQDGVVYRVTADDGSPLWSVPVAETVFSSPLIAGDAVYVGSSDGVRALALADGAVRWTAATGVQFQSSPWVDGTTVFIGADDNNLYALDSATGAVRWQANLGGAVFSSPVVAGGLVYVGSLDNGIYALDSAPVRSGGALRQAVRSTPHRRSTVGTCTSAATTTAVRAGCGDGRHRMVVRDQRLDLLVGSGGRRRRLRRQLRRQHLRRRRRPRRRGLALRCSQRCVLVTQGGRRHRLRRQPRQPLVRPLDRGRLRPVVVPRPERSSVQRRPWATSASSSPRTTETCTPSNADRVTRRAPASGRDSSRAGIVPESGKDPAQKGHHLPAGWNVRLHGEPASRRRRGDGLRGRLAQAELDSYRRTACRRRRRGAHERLLGLHGLEEAGDPRR